MREIENKNIKEKCYMEKLEKIFQSHKGKSQYNSRKSEID